VPRDQLISRAEAILRQIGANAPLAVKFALEAVNKGVEATQDQGLAIEASLFGLCRDRGQVRGHLGLPRQARSQFSRPVTEPFGEKCRPSLTKHLGCHRDCAKE
jgi:enoyl-CoA hydratase/carnithine racemase